MTRGRIPAAVVEVEDWSVNMWAAAACSGLEAGWNDVEARLFGAGQILRSIGQGRAAVLAFFLAALAGHRAVLERQNGRR